MPWIFGSFLVTPYALTRCHVVICNQGSTIRTLGYNRCVTGRRPRDENYAVRFRQSAENWSRPWDTQPTRSSLTSLQGGASVGTAWKKIWEEVLSLSIYISSSISQLTTNSGPFSRIK